MALLPPTVAEVGEFIDKKTANYRHRTPQAVMGRLIEEITECAFALGMTYGDISHHVADAAYNQAVKYSQQQGRTIFPSHINRDFIPSAPPNIKNPATDTSSDIIFEIADVRLVLKDLIYVLDYSPAVIDKMEITKWHKFTGLEFNVSDSGCLYAKKPHIKA